MPVSLINSAYQIKQQLIAYALEHYADIYQQLESEIYPDKASEIESMALQDWFALEYILPNQRTILSHFISDSRLENEISIAQQWGIVIHGVFHVRQVLGDNHYELMNLVNDVTYNVAGKSGEDLALEKGEYILARLIPHQDYHLFSGVIDRLATRKKNEIYELVSEIQLTDPKMAFIDNLDRIEMAYQIQKEEREDFIAFFGSDEILLNGSELEDKMKEFYHYRFFQKKQENGNTIAKTFQDRYHQSPLPPQFDFIENLDQEKDIGVIYDATEGLVLLLKYGQFQEIFRREDFKRIKNFRQLILGYLDDNNISSLPFRRMAKQYPEQSVEVYKAVLKRKYFKLDKDLPKLILRFKPMEQLIHLTPSTIPSSVRSKTFLRSLKSRSKW